MSNLAQISRVARLLVKQSYEAQVEMLRYKREHMIVGDFWEMFLPNYDPRKDQRSYHASNFFTSDLRVFKAKIFDVLREKLSRRSGSFVDIILGKNGLGRLLPRALKTLIEDINTYIVSMGCELSHLQLQENTLKILDPAIFRGLRSLRALCLDNNDILSLHRNIFQGLDTLERLSIENCGVTRLEPGIFDRLSNLLLLSMGRNNLVRLEPGLFNHLTKLTLLLLIGTSLTQYTTLRLQPGIFDGLQNLRWLNFHNSAVVKLEPGIFKGLKNLEGITVPFELFTSLDPKAFSGLPKFRMIRVSGFQPLPEEYVKTLRKALPQVEFVPRFQ